MKRMSYRLLMVVAVGSVLGVSVPCARAQDGDPYSSGMNIGGGQDPDEFASDEVRGAAKTSSRKNERVARKVVEEKPAEKKGQSDDSSAADGGGAADKKQPSKRADPPSNPPTSGSMDDPDF